MADFRKKDVDGSLYDRIKSSLIKSGKVKLDLSIESVQNHIYIQGEPLDWISGKDVVFKNHKKTYYSILSNDYSQILFINEIGKIQSKNKID